MMFVNSHAFISFIVIVVRLRCVNLCIVCAKECTNEIFRCLCRSFYWADICIKAAGRLCNFIFRHLWPVSI